MSTAKNRLQAASVPWRIPGAGGDVETRASEESVVAFLFVFFGKHVADAEVARLEAEGRLTDDAYNRAGYGEIRLDFEDFAGCRVHPQLRPVGLWDEDAFDESAISDARWEPGSSCPDPAVYEVVDSEWLQGFAHAPKDLRHWLIRDHSQYVEVLARTMTWTRVGARSRRRAP